MKDISFKSKTIIVLSLSFTGLISLWTLNSQTSNLTRSNDKTTFDILYQDIPENRNICTSDSYNKGKWVKQVIGLTSDTIDGMNEHAGYFCNWNFPHKCYRREGPGDFNRSKAILDYTWQPDDCMIYPFKARDFSRHLAENPLLFVGDSITQLMFESSWCLLGQDLTVQNKNIGLSGGDTNMWANQLVHRDLVDQEGAISLAYIRSDYIVKLDDFSFVKPNEGEGYQIGRGNNYPWVQAIPKFKYIMINTGPHWHPDLKWGPNQSREELLDAFKKAMKKAFDYLRNTLREDQQLWVRSTPYGHAKCSQYKTPSVPPVAPTGKEGEYEWDMFEKFDQVWKTMIEESGDDRFHFFNVSLSNFRGDVHSMPDSDCLHTCLPGPVDDWNKFFFHEVKTHVIDKINNAIY